MSLLSDLFASAREDEYSDAAARPRPPAGETGSPWRQRRVRAAVLLTAGVAVLGLLLVTTVIQTRRTAPAAAAQRASLIERIEAARATTDDLRERVTTAERALDDARAAALATSQEGAAIADDLAAMSLQAGAVAVNGPGVVIVLDDAPADADLPPEVTPADARVHDDDLRQAINGLWLAGAEAVSVNGTRVSSRTAVREAGEALVIDLTPLQRPYVVEAIGSPETLAPRFLDTPGATWLETIALRYGIEYAVSTRAELTLPPAATGELEWARPGRGTAE